MRRLCIWTALSLIAAAQQPAQEFLKERKIVVGSPVEERQVLRPPKSTVVVPRGLALIVGIAGYANLDPADNLQFPERDAELIHKTLVSKEGGNFAPENVKLLIGRDATVAAFRNAFEGWLVKSARPEDRVVVYFAGHGVTGPDGRGYLALYDYDPQRPEAAGYSMERFGDVFRDRIGAEQKVLFTDACHSGAISRDLATVNDSVSNLNGVKGLLTFAASTNTQVAFEDTALKHGIFSYYLAKAFEQGDRNNDGVVTAAELVDYVKNHVWQHTTDRKQRQTPRENQGFPDNLPLGFNPKRTASDVTLTEGTLVIQSNMDEVEVLLDGVSQGTVGRGRPLQLPGIKAGTHTVQGVKMGYDPDGPREIVVYPGAETPVSIRIQFARTRKKSAETFFKNGRELYQHSKNESDCKQAIDLFKKALREDPRYSEAAMYLGHAYRVLFDSDSAERSYKLAIEIDPDYVEARMSYAAMLTEVGNTDAAVRQFLQALERDPRNDAIYANLAHAYRVAENFDRAAEIARKALELNPKNANAHLFLGDCLRFKNKFDEASKEYTTYLTLSDFNPNLALKVVGYLVLPTFTTKNASRRMVYRDMKNQAYFGLCVCEQKLRNFNVAIQYCREALHYDSKDPFSYFHLGWINVEKYEMSFRREYLLAARSNFEKVIDLNPDLQESNTARQYLEQIQDVLKRMPSSR